MLLLNLQDGGLELLAIWAYHDTVLAGLCLIVAIGIVESEQFGSDFELYLLTLAGLEMHLLEASQFLDRSDGIAHHSTDIELHYLIAGIVTDIGDGEVRGYW